MEERKKDIKATDDYFFEEAWRHCGEKMKCFEIPGEMSTRRAPKDFKDIMSRKLDIFFKFGESGNVDEFRGKVEQHTPSKINYDTRISLENSGKQSIDNLINDCFKYDHMQILKSIPHTLGKGYSESEREQVKSLFSYWQNKDVFIPLHWWWRPAPGNMGDWLSPYIIHKLTGFSVAYANCSDSNLISLGSIGRYIRKPHVVWGTGMSTKETELCPSANYLALRGPHTAQALRKAGGPAIDLFGDPGILLNSIYKPKTIRNSSTYAVVRHFVHQDAPILFDEDIKEVNILLSNPYDLENFIDQLYACKGVITTSLHVTIICHAYKIPCRLVRINNATRQVHGDGIKYKDYFEGMRMRTPEIPILETKLKACDFDTFLLDDFPDHSQDKDLIYALKNQIRENPSSILKRSPASFADTQHIQLISS